MNAEMVLSINMDITAQDRQDVLTLRVDLLASVQTDTSLLIKVASIQNVQVQLQLYIYAHTIVTFVRH